MASHAKALWLAGGLLVGGLAHAGGASHDAPAIDVSGLPDGAVVRPETASDDPHPVEARLLTEQSVVAPGDTLTVGVHLVQDEHWHTYWHSPGDIGLPTEITLTVPGEARPRVWVVPERFEQEGIVSFGYDHEVLHQVEVQLPDDLPAGELALSADVSWLVCKTSCIPGQASLSTTVEVGETAAPGPHTPLFEHYRERWPTPLERVAGLDVEVVHCLSAVVPDGPVRTAVSVQPTDAHVLARDGEALWPTFTAAPGFDWMVDGLEVHEDPDGSGLFVTIAGTAFAPDPLPSTPDVGGLVQVLVDGAWVRTEVSDRLPWSAEKVTLSKGDHPACAAFSDLDEVVERVNAEVAGDDAVAEAPEPKDEPGPDEDEPVPGTTPPNTGGAGALSVSVMLTNLLMAFVGGLILNVMPCVLPVLTLKLYGLVEQAGIDQQAKRAAGLSYTAGILVSFWALALGVVFVRLFFGESVGWGYQMQYPGYVAALSIVVFLFGLSLFGVFEIPAVGTGRAHELSTQEGASGHFFTGVFATLVATPCSAPFLGVAIAFAFSAPTAVLFLMFTVIGLGLASPFLVVAFVPGAYRLLPKPGAWMESFKQFLGFTLMATTAWLVSVLAAQIGLDRIGGFLFFLTAVGVGAWIFGRWGGVAAEGKDQLKALAVALVVVTVSGWTLVDLEMAEDGTCAEEALACSELDFDEEIPWQAFSEDNVASLSGQTLFLDFTADWCVSCKVNEKTVLETAAVREAMAEHCVVPMVADYTRKDPTIGAWLERFDRAGVPMYLVIPPTGVDDAVLLPEVITQDMVIGALEAAATETVGRR